MKKMFNLGNISKAVVLGLGLPFAAFAQINTILTNFKETLNIVLTLLFVLITIYFIWGVIVYVTAGGDDEKLARGKKHMLWGIIGLAVVAAAWGFARLLTDYFGVSDTTLPIPPSF